MIAVGALLLLSLLPSNLVNGDGPGVDADGDRLHRVLDVHCAGPGVGGPAVAAPPSRALDDVWVDPSLEVGRRAAGPQRVRLDLSGREVAVHDGLLEGLDEPRPRRRHLASAGVGCPGGEVEERPAPLSATPTARWSCLMWSATTTVRWLRLGRLGRWSGRWSAPMWLATLMVGSKCGREADGEIDGGTGGEVVGVGEVDETDGEIDGGVVGTKMARLTGNCLVK